LEINKCPKILEFSSRMRSMLSSTYALCRLVKSKNIMLHWNAIALSEVLLGNKAVWNFLCETACIKRFSCTLTVLVFNKNKKQAKFLRCFQNSTIINLNRIRFIVIKYLITYWYSLYRHTYTYTYIYIYIYI